MRLADGTRLVLRPLEREDADLVREIFDHLGARSRYQRYLVPKQRLTGEDVRRLTAVDHYCHEAVVALTVPEGRPIGIARFVRYRKDLGSADLAIEVVDAWQERGVGSVLTDALVSRAHDLAVERFSVLMAAENTGAARLMRRVPGQRRRISSGPAAEFEIVLRPAC